MAKIEKVKPENLAPSQRSPVIPVVTEGEKVVYDPTVEKKAKKKAQPKAAESKKPEKKASKELSFPATVRVNHYGFINLRKSLRDALGWTVDLKLTIEQNGDGSITLRKA